MSASNSPVKIAPTIRVFKKVNPPSRRRKSLYINSLQPYILADGSIDLNALATNGNPGMVGFIVSRSDVPAACAGSLVIIDMGRSPRNGDAILVAGRNGPEVVIYRAPLSLIASGKTDHARRMIASGEIIGVVKASMNLFIS